MNVICPHAADLERCNRFSNCCTLGAPTGQMDRRVGGPKAHGICSRSDESSDIGAICYCFRFLNFCSAFKSQHSERELGRKSGQNFAFLTPVKNRGGLVKKICRDYSCHTSFLSGCYGTQLLFTRRQLAVLSH